MSNDVHCWPKKCLTTPGAGGIGPDMASTRKALATLDDLRPDPENPREISAEALDGLAVSVCTSPRGETENSRDGWRRIGDAD